MRLGERQWLRQSHRGIGRSNAFELERDPRKRRVVWHKAYLISLKRSETTLGCAAADRAVVEGPELASGHRDGDDISPKALGPVSGLVQCLGEMPWEAGRLRSSPTTRISCGLIRESIP